MSDAAENLEGQIVDGKFALVRYLGGSGHSLAFLTERKTDPRKAAIKLVPADDRKAGAQLARWEAATKIAHPGLIQLFETGRCQIHDQTYLYVVMEYADDNLYQILPNRPLSPEEAREMLPPVLQALRHLHGQGFIHGHMKPSNIMACGDQIKISSDGILRMGQVEEATPAPSLYNPPEAASAGLSPAGDVWSLGVTVVEALTQHPPVREGAADQNLPQSLPAPFAEMVRNCLRPRPEQRWFVDQIAAYLKPPAPAAKAPATVPAPAPELPLKPARPAVPAATANVAPTFKKPALLVAVSLIAVALFVVAAVKLWHYSQESPAPSPDSTQTSAPQPSAAASPAEAAPTTAAPQPPPATVAPAEHATPKAAGAVVQKIVPEVPRSALHTIQGTIRVKVRVRTDAGGNVSSATVASGGSSAYFERLALQAARKWQFTPADAPTSWLLTFEFRQNGARAAASQTGAPSAD